MTVLEQPSYSRLDHVFARFLTKLSPVDDTTKRVFNAILLRLSNQLSQGHSCISVNADECAVLISSTLADASGLLPLVIEDDRLYLQRYWHYETRLAQQLQVLLTTEKRAADLDVLRRYFPAASDTVVDWQYEAVKHALQHALTIITGGPGTGKTTTIVRLLAALQECAGEQPLHIALAAPTGKAAMRLAEAIRTRIAELPCGDDIKQRIPEQVYTLHRLLGPKPPSPYFSHDSDNPLTFDWVVVDEASMVDLSLMSKLVDALKPGANLVLLGDKHQLASVEAGAVLADLTSALPAQTVELQVSHRFHGAIKALADSVNQQQAQTAWALLQQDSLTCNLLCEDLLNFIVAQVEPYFTLVANNADFVTLFTEFSRFQVLSATRLGDYGVVALNQRLERKLVQLRKIPHDGWYPGRPVIILQNNPALRLYNGDIGLCLPDPKQNNRLMVFFQRADGQVHSYLPTRLPPCESVYAMTIHKSQGSEFDEVLIVLPEYDIPLLTKELLYTAITRAKNKINVFSQANVFLAATQRKIERVSGLAAKLNNF
ncbi:exodeoxyribonuclease V subunit alpha [Methylocucumis oryzae]|uniref:RecBCD enzyme subunit RecD n=1 Tax=Methylocucumis oryzae TaxID=1632867 RepID=A0A0F3IKQ2_9GAMM|nr:exodeoxyribonuclease V subunit alpha [Methylocucumis oryzae]KJV07320.1 exodeoxyribonuclease V subunit alpha [Methylocucumis oryzae]